MDLDRFDLMRFVEAQEHQYQSVLRELRSGRKTTHWMWYIFPQLKGLGSSPMAQRFAIASREEAVAYLAHPVLGPRLKECTSLVIELAGRPIGAIFPYPDDLKFRSCMTLFVEASDDRSIFQAALNQYFGGQADSATLEILRRQV